MATATFAERIQDDLAVLVATPTMIDLSNQRDADLAEDAARTLRVCQMAAARVEAKLGDVGSYDDADGLIGDQQALDLGIRMALMMYSQVYTLTLSDAGVRAIENLVEELETLAASRRQEAGTPVVKNRENTEFNQRHDGPDWPDVDDTDAP